MTSALQTAIIQVCRDGAAAVPLPLAVSTTVPVPSPPTEHHVLVRVLAVALNPNDHKMITHFPMPGNVAGCDFCGVVVERGEGNTNLSPTAPTPGTRVCGAIFPYQPGPNQQTGAFAQFVCVDARLLLRIPDGWSDLQGAALGGVGWSTVCLALSDPDALALPCTPSKPQGPEKKVPVLVYGGATATGTLACQLLDRSGYIPIAVTSAASSPLALEYGAVGTAQYTSPDCSQVIRTMAQGVPIRHALDCITDFQSSATCFAAISRAGGRYTCLEKLPQAWRTRQTVKIKEVMGYEILGVEVHLGDSTYTRTANDDMFRIGQRWVVEIQSLLDAGRLRHHPVKELPGKWDSIMEGLGMLQRGAVRGEKLVIRISDL